MTRGHLIASPKEIQEGIFTNPGGLINQILLPGTPLAIPTHEQHCHLLDYLADQLGVHPRNFFFKGSTKIGFSIAPKPEKVWMEYGPASDLDLAIVDPNFFHLLDGQVRQWDRDPANASRKFQNKRLFEAYSHRIMHKGKYECYRFFDLPPIPGLVHLNQCLDLAPVKDACGLQRGIRAFVFRDWWGVYQRYDSDLHELRKGLTNRVKPFPAGGDSARPFVEKLG